MLTVFYSLRTMHPTAPEDLHSSHFVDAIVNLDCSAVRKTMTVPGSNCF